MKTNEQQIFDELMRQKLGDYTEEPDMELLGNIHAKKNRLIKLYGLYKMFAIVCIVGLGMLSAYMLLKPAQQLSSDNTNVTNTESYTPTTSDNTTSYYNKSTYTNTSSVSASSDLLPSTAISNVNANSSANGKALYNANTTSTNNNQQNFKNNTSDTKSTSNNNQKINTSGSTIKDAEEVNASSNDVNKHEDLKSDTLSLNTKSDKKVDKEKPTTSECKAAFDFYASYDGKFNFTNFSEAGPTAKLVWDFGDGSQSSLSSPIHTYLQKGTYIVTLKVIDETNSCSNSFQKTIAYDVNKTKKSGISLKGKVIGNSEPVGNGRVKLLAYDNTINAYVFTAKSTTSLSGEYSFDNVKSGRYLILAEGNNNSFIPTYWGNSTDMDYAVDVNILENDDQDMLGYTISLSVNKDITTGNDAKIAEGDSSKEGTLFVLDQNNNRISSVKTDKNGNADLSDLPPGNYSLLDPKTGLSSKVSIKRGGADESVIGSAPSQNGSITLVPNPAVNNFKFDLMVKKSSNAEITIINSGGSIVYSGSYVCNDGANPMDIDIYNLPPGVYYVVVSVGGQQTMSGRLIKKAGDDR
jgi:hypothetical protein